MKKRSSMSLQGFQCKLHQLTRSSAKIVYQQLALKHNLVDRFVPYYKYQPNPVLEDSFMKLYWDRDIITDVLIRAELELKKDLNSILKAVILGACSRVRRFLNHHN